GIEPEHRGRAAGGTRKPEQEPDQSRLARAVSAEQPDRSPGHTEVQVIERQVLPVAPGEADRFDHRWTGEITPRTRRASIRCGLHPESPSRTNIDHECSREVPSGAFPPGSISRRGLAGRRPG